jgi:hypothetical protein
MADYYPLITKAVARLDPDAPGESRRALYERARTALLAQLRNMNPPFTEAEIARERLALEKAVLRVEGEVVQRARDTRAAALSNLLADADEPSEAAAEAKRRHYTLRANAMTSPSPLKDISVEMPSMILTGGATGRLNRIWRWRGVIRPAQEA